MYYKYGLVTQFTKLSNVYHEPLENVNTNGTRSRAVSRGYHAVEYTSH